MFLSDELYKRRCYPVKFNLGKRDRLLSLPSIRP